MAQFLGFGDGSDGDLNISGNTTDAPIDSSCSGASGGSSLSATNASFVAGQYILIHQSRGTGAGAWEVNRILSYVAGTITTEKVLANTYTDSGDSQAQVLVLKQYSSITIQSGISLTAKAWDGNVGGIVAMLCSGPTNIIGTITAAGKGFRGGAGVANNRSYTGEGSIGASVQKGGTDESANGSGGGGGGQSGGGGAWDAGGGGGGHATSGENGSGNGAAADAGTGGGTVGSADLTTMLFGGGGGGRSNETGSNTRDGVAGGGIVLIISNSFVITGAISVNGTSPGTNGGGGAAGSVFIKAVTATLGTNLITATDGTKTDLSGGGGDGRIRVEACDITGSTATPVDSESEGGFDFCAVGGGQVF